MVYRISDTCIACGTCESNCPVGAIYMGNEKYEINQEICMGCGNCANVCPVGAPAEDDA